MNFQGLPGSGIPLPYNPGAPVYHQSPYHMSATANMHNNSLDGQILPQHIMPHSSEIQNQDTGSEYVHQASVLMQENTSITAATFDSFEELIWVGNNLGYISSYCGPNLQKYTGFRVPTNPEQGVVQIMSSSAGIFTLSQCNLRLYTRFGRYTGEASFEESQQMQCIAHLPNSILVGGHHPIVFEFDLKTFRATNKYTIDTAGVALIRANNRHFMFGDASGKITLRDSRSLKAEHSFQAHSGTLSDFDCYDNQIITCGFSTVRGNYQLDRFLMVYDTRMMRSVAPIQCTIEPYFLKFVHSYTSRVLVVSHSGQYQVMDTGALTSTSLMTHNIPSVHAPISAFDVSSSSQNAAFCDMSGCLHLYSTAHRDGNQVMFNPYSHETQFADVAERYPEIDICDPLATYSSVPMPYPGHGNLLSDWPPEFCQRVYRNPVPVDNAIMNNVRMTGNIGYAKLPEGVSRPFPYMSEQLHQRPPGGANSNNSHVNTKSSMSVSNVASSPSRPDDQSVPKQFRKVEIKYSKLGLEDFDFRLYNKTHFAGLETHIPNAYCNCMLQVLYFIEPLRATLLNHICTEEFCLTCELGFLFHMLDISKGMTCQASNFLRAFRTLPEASALGLILGDDDEASKKNLARIIQNWSRFVLQQIHSELTRLKADGSSPKETEEKTIVQKLFGTNSTTVLECKCGEISNRDSETFLYNMIYPEAPVDIPHFEFARVLFSQIVADSMNASQAQQSWCDKCKKYQPHTQSRVLKNIPDVIGLNCQVDNDTTQDFWQRQLDLIAKDSEQASRDTPQVSQSSAFGRVKPCRYGDSCTRHDCYFYHEGRDMLNTTIKTTPKSDLPPWVPLGLAIKLLPNGHVSVRNLQDISDKGEEGEVVYEMLAGVAHIRDAKHGNHLVAQIHVGETYHQRKEGVTTTQFYILNDFSISDIEKEEAARFNMDWKWPCALFYVRRRFNDDYRIAVENQFEKYESLFLTSAFPSDRIRSITMIPLSDEEKLSSGDVVGLDAEFVSLNQEEAELRSDGTKSTIKPPQFCVARVTCIRGNGANLDKELHMKPFMDDYIRTQEEVVDYLTQFSGIKPGDLDVSLSSKHLTTHKSMYIKLRYMIQKGVIFVGHGLKKDFRVINVVVPPKQVIDTVELFNLPKQRMISLKFLSWYFLGETIQSDSHDSIEDAQTALKLYEKYKELETAGLKNLKGIIIDMYDRGRLIKWNIPENAPPGIPGLDISTEELKQITSELQNA